MLCRARLWDCMSSVRLSVGVTICRTHWIRGPWLKVKNSIPQGEKYWFWVTRRLKCGSRNIGTIPQGEKYTHQDLTDPLDFRDCCLRFSVTECCFVLFATTEGITTFLPRDASAERGYEIACRPSVRLSVRLSVTFRYRVQIGLNSSKIISRPNSLRPLLWLTPNMGDLVQREHPQN